MLYLKGGIHNQILGVKGSNNHTPCSSTVAYFALFYRNELILQSFLQNEVVKCSLNDLKYRIASF